MSFFDDYVSDGCCCAGCGEFMGGGEPGHIRYCSSCARANREQDRLEPRVPAFRAPPRHARNKSKTKGETVPCPQCQRLVSPIGLKHHQIDKHGKVS